MPFLAVPFTLALATGPPCDARRIYARVRAVTGGSRWNDAAEMISEGKVTGEGLHGTFRSATDVRDGRSALHIRLWRLSTAEVYDGHMDWQQDWSSGVHALNSPNAHAAAVTNAYINRSGYFDPSRDKATSTCLGTRSEGARSFYVVRIVPQGGLAADQWIDAASFLIDRTIEATPTSEIVTRQSDYRQIDGLVLPFETRSGTIGDPSDDRTLTETRYEVRASASNDDFRRPPDPTDTRLLGGRTSTTVPISVEGGEVIVKAAIDGKGPFPFILDTGGHAILTPQAARTIGLKAEGSGTSGGGGAGRIAQSYTYVRSLRIGDAEIPAQPFLVIPYDNNFSDRGQKPPLAGILGLEVFERFAVRIDYAHAQMTMTPLHSFEYAGKGARAPIVFQEDMPLMTAVAEGKQGWFGVDTGNSGMLILFGAFLERYDLLKRHARGNAATTYGTGGAVHTTTHIIDRFTVGGRTLHFVPALFVVGQHGGSFSSTTEAGNVGYNILANFVPTFDYRAGNIYFESSARGPMPPYGRSGLALLKPTHYFFNVAGVRPNSPASAAGIAAGDRVVAINGRPASIFGYGDIYAIMRQPPGTIVTLDLIHDKIRRTVYLKLRNVPLPTQ